jgi:hypothetical protein
VKLVGKLLNTSDELGTAEAIASDRFKAIITGAPLTGRDVYRPATDPRAEPSTFSRATNSRHPEEVWTEALSGV